MNNKPKKITIHEIADEAGVSISTVSRVMNNMQYVSKETRERVEKAISKLKFKPDFFARGMRGMSSNLIALLIPNILDVYYTNIAQEIEGILREKGFTVLLGISHDQSSLMLDCFEKVSKISVDGIIYVPPPSEQSSPYIRSMAQTTAPIVELFRRREIDLYDGVEADNFGAAGQAMDYLFSLGHRKIAFMTGPTSTSSGARRLEGYKYYLNNKGIELVPELIKVGDYSKEFGEQATEEILKVKGIQKPTAIFSASNRILKGTMKALRREKVNVPEDISVIAMDDADWLESFEPPITTVDVAIEQMASLTVDLLLERINHENKSGNPRTYTLSTILKIRGSCLKIN